MKARASIGTMCPDCYITKRRNANGKQRMRVYCKTNARHKQVQR